MTPSVRFTAALVCALGAFVVVPAHAAYGDLFIFGDSVSDSGNVAAFLQEPSGVPQTVSGNGYIPSAPYEPSGTFSNGPVWATDFANLLGLAAAPSLLGGTDFAFGGARTGGSDATVPSLIDQAGLFLTEQLGSAPSSALYVVAGVGNDARDALQTVLQGGDPNTAIPAAAAAYANNVGDIVDELRRAGARDFLVFNTVNLGLTPAVTSLGAAAAGVASFISSAMDGALAARLAGQAGVTIFDTYSFLTGVVDNPADFGFTNATDACGAIAGADCSRYVFWDGIHPTAAMHSRDRRRGLRSCRSGAFDLRAVRARPDRRRTRRPASDAALKRARSGPLGNSARHRPRPAALQPAPRHRPRRPPFPAAGAWLCGRRERRDTVPRPQTHRSGREIPRPRPHEAHRARPCCARPRCVYVARDRAAARATRPGATSRPLPKPRWSARSPTGSRWSRCSAIRSACRSRTPRSSRATRTASATSWPASSATTSSARSRCWPSCAQLRSGGAARGLAGRAAPAPSRLGDARWWRRALRPRRASTTRACATSSARPSTAGLDAGRRRRGWPARRSTR